MNDKTKKTIREQLTEGFTPKYIPPKMPKVENPCVLKNDICDLYAEIEKAKIEAIKNNIKANSIIINTNLVEVPKLLLNMGVGCVELPPMICGLETHFTDKELPDEYNFAIMEAPQTEREKLIKGIRELAARELFAKAIELSDTSETTYEFQNRLIDFVEQHFNIEIEHDRR